MNASVGGDLMRKRVRVDTLQFFEFAIFNNQTGQFVGLGQLFEHRFAGGDATGRSLATRNDIQRFKTFSYLLRRINIELTSGEHTDFAGEFLQLFAEMTRQLGKYLGVHTNACAFHPIEYRRQRQFNLAINAGEILFVDSLTQDPRNLHREVSTFGSLPGNFIPAFVWRPAAFGPQAFACQID